MVELAPKVLDGTRCYTESLDMCISGACQVGDGRSSFGPPRTESPRLSGSRSSAAITSWAARPRRTTAACAAATAPPAGWCGDTTDRSRTPAEVRTPDRSRIWRLSQSGHPGLCLLRPGEDTVVVIPYRSRHVRLVLKGPDHLCKSREVQDRSWSGSGPPKGNHFQLASLLSSSPPPHQMDNKCCVSAGARTRTQPKIPLKVFPSRPFWLTLLKLQPCVSRQGWLPLTPRLLVASLLSPSEPH